MLHIWHTFFVSVEFLKFDSMRVEFVMNALDVFIIFTACVCIAVGVLDLFWFKTTLMFGYFLVSLLHGSES